MIENLYFNAYMQTNIMMQQLHIIYYWIKQSKVEYFILIYNLD